MKKSFLLLAVPVALLFTSLILWHHLDTSYKSMLRLNTDQSKAGLISNEYLPSVVDWHKKVFDFAKRPLTTQLVEFTAAKGHLAISDSFVLVNFLFLFCNGVLLFILSLRHFCTWKKAIFNVFFYYFSFVILFSFFPPVYSYDEPMQYFFIFCMILAWYEKRMFFFMLFAFMALLSRETSILVLAGLYFFHRKSAPFKARELLLFMFPLLLYLGFLSFYIYQNHLWELMKTDTALRNTAFSLNFVNQTYSVESLMALVSTALVPLYFLAVFYKKKDASSFKPLYDSILLVFFLNTFICFFLTAARETRLFNLPFILFYPIAYKVLEEMELAFNWKNIQAVFSNWRCWIILSTVIFIAYIVSFKIFATTIGRDVDNLFNEYTFFILIMVMTHAVLDRQRRPAG